MSAPTNRFDSAPRHHPRSRAKDDGGGENLKSLVSTDIGQTSAAKCAVRMARQASATIKIQKSADGVQSRPLAPITGERACFHAVCLDFAKSDGQHIAAAGSAERRIMKNGIRHSTSLTSC
jgi:hypothetical protein